MLSRSPVLPTLSRNFRSPYLPPLQRFLKGLGILLLVAVLCLGWSDPSWAELKDDRYEGNIFALYGANGALIPPKLTLEQSLERETPTVLIYYIDDSRDCKQFASAIGNLQVRYGLGVTFIAYAIDALDLSDPEGPGQYYTGQVPQTLIFSGAGEITYESVGNRPLVEVENAIRALLDLELLSAENRQARPFNEVQTGYGRGPAAEPTQ